MPNSPLCWIGGKSLLAKTIIARLPEHETYCEVFAGAGWVFFRKEESRFEILNDINGDLVTFYRVLQHHLEEFCRQFKWLLASREWWEDWTRQAAAGGLTDVQRAARFYYIQRLGFGGKVASRTFGSGPRERPRINLLRLEEDLSEAHLRLARATIEHLPFADFLARYDRPGTCFYLDPPYWGMENYYGKGIFGREDFERLAEILTGLQGRFILSLNDVPAVRETFKDFRIEPVATKYSCGRDTIQAREVLISNYEMEVR
jgi:DNA adenine methylase